MRHIQICWMWDHVFYHVVHGAFRTGMKKTGWRIDRSAVKISMQSFT